MLDPEQIVIKSEKIGAGTDVAGKACSAAFCLGADLGPAALLLTLLSAVAW